MLTSNDNAVIIRTARRAHSCSCHLPAHRHTGPRTNTGTAWCPNVIKPGEQYPEYLGESPAYQSGHRYCPDCRKDQLGDWIAE